MGQQWHCRVWWATTRSPWPTPSTASPTSPPSSLPSPTSFKFVEPWCHQNPGEGNVSPSSVMTMKFDFNSQNTKNFVNSRFVFVMKRHKQVHMLPCVWISKRYHDIDISLHIIPNLNFTTRKHHLLDKYCHTWWRVSNKKSQILFSFQVTRSTANFVRVKYQGLGLIWNPPGHPHCHCQYHDWRNHRHLALSFKWTWKIPFVRWSMQ